MQHDSELLTVADVAQRLRVSTSTVRNLIRRRVLHGINVGSAKRPHWRILGAELERFLREREGSG
jgi:excisionase family DNA binding protein